MANTTTFLNTEEYEACTLCSSKHDRIRPSFCQCKHCSIPLCLSCMNEHHDELLQNVVQISHEYNELYDLFKEKQKMLVEETTTSVEDINHYFETYINELRQTQQKIILNTENAKQNAQNFLSEVGTTLQNLGSVIQVLSKENAVLTTKLDHLSAELQKVKQQIHTFHTKKIENLTKTIPEFTLEFEYCSASAPNMSQPLVLEPTTVVQPEIKISAPEVTQPSIQLSQCQDKDEDFQISYNSGNNKNDKHVTTKFVINRMASNGKDVLYTSYFDDRPDIVAYCFMNENNNLQDQHREWKQLRIEDMIWWKKINQFVCATENAIYAVSFANSQLKFVPALRGNWSNIRVAANSNEIFVHFITSLTNKNKILVCAPNFQVLKVFNTSNHRYLSNAWSFCVTDRFLASICIPSQNHQKVFQVTFFDLEMNVLNRVCLGQCNELIEIRTDGNDRFFITTGRRQLHIVSPNGQQNTVNLDHDGNCIAVLDNQRIAVSNQRKNMELVTY